VFQQYAGSLDQAVGAYKAKLEAGGWLVTLESRTDMPPSHVLQIARADGTGCKLNACQVVLSTGAAGTDVLMQVSQ
jgi:hypothetical protein